MKLKVTQTTPNCACKLEYQRKLRALDFIKFSSADSLVSLNDAEAKFLIGEVEFDTMENLNKLLSQFKVVYIDSQEIELK